MRRAQVQGVVFLNGKLQFYNSCYLKIQVDKKDGGKEVVGSTRNIQGVYSVDSGPSIRRSSLNLASTSFGLSETRSLTSTAPFRGFQLLLQGLILLGKFDTKRV